jgi:hypothetical protein
LVHRQSVECLTGESVGSTGSRPGPLNVSGYRRGR